MKKFYTGTGDDGYTGLLGDERVPKHHLRMETLGTLDEATAALGLARASCQAPDTGRVLLEVQRDLYQLMAEVASTPENAPSFRKVDTERVAWLEEVTDRLAASVQIPNEFILPGDSPAGAALALARTIVRRAERRITKMFHEGALENLELLRYLNRLSSCCFLLELLENQVAGKASPSLAKE